MHTCIINVTLHACICVHVHMHLFKYIKHGHIPMPNQIRYFLRLLHHSTPTCGHFLSLGRQLLTILCGTVREL